MNLIIENHNAWFQDIIFLSDNWNFASSDVEVTLEMDIGRYFTSLQLMSYLLLYNTDKEMDIILVSNN